MNNAYSLQALTVRYFTDVVRALNSHASYFPREPPSISRFEARTCRCSARGKTSPSTKQQERSCFRVGRNVRWCVSWWLSVLRGFHVTIVVGGDHVLSCATTYMMVERSW